MLFIEKLPLRADKCITNHVRILQDTMHLAAELTFFTDGRGNCDTTLNESLLQEERYQHVTAKNRVFPEERTNDINKNEGIHAEENNKNDEKLQISLNKFQNWRGRAEIPTTSMPKNNLKLSKKSFCLNPKAEWSKIVLLENNIQKQVKICLLKNGGIMKLKANRTTVGEIISTNFTDSKTLESTEKDKKDVFLLAKNLLKTSSLRTVYEYRAKIMIESNLIQLL
ncbi:hypothetical protein FQA39_LY07493 [Lamprigera yunnana]|nr:hypothetical protein FQA39_LY07493 [Lamprigera yunnana]